MFSALKYFSIVPRPVKELEEELEEADKKFWDSIEDLDKTITKFRKKKEKDDVHER